MPNSYLLFVYTGPGLVRPVADVCRAAGLYVTIEGTDGIYLVAEGSDASAAAHNVLVDLQRAHGKDFGLRPRSIRAARPSDIGNREG